MLNILGDIYTVKYDTEYKDTVDFKACIFFVSTSNNENTESTFLRMIFEVVRRKLCLDLPDRTLGALSTIIPLVYMQNSAYLKISESCISKSIEEKSPLEDTERAASAYVKILKDLDNIEEKHKSEKKSPYLEDILHGYEYFDGYE